MRFKSILLEYIREKTIENYKDALWARMGADGSASAEYSHAIMVTKHPAKESGTTYREACKRNLAVRFLQTAESADPTPNNSYVQWVTTRYLSGGISRFEDIASSVSDNLAEYDELKRSGYFKRATGPIKEAGDINRIKSLFELRAVVKQGNNENIESQKVIDKKLKTALIYNGHIEIIVDTPKCQVAIPHNEEAAQVLGRNTQWCTAARSNNAFRTYNAEGPLFVILDKPNNMRWQLHFETASFMDENDSRITDTGWFSLPSEAFSEKALAFYQRQINTMTNLEVIHCIQELPSETQSAEGIAKIVSSLKARL
jgi:hypothetical protein